MLDNSIILQCKRKEPQALKQCYEACAPYIYTIVKSYIYEPEMRKDVMQDIFANIFTSLHTYDFEKGKFKSWIASIAINQSIAHLRKQKKLAIFTNLDEIQETVEIQESRVNDLSKEQLEILLEYMPAGYRTVFLLSVIDGYSHKEIGEILHTTPENSRSQLSRGLQWIKKNILVDTKNFIYG